MYSIAYAKGVGDDLASLRVYDRAKILDAIEAQLTSWPTEQTRNRKILVGLVPTWQHVESIWELRVGEYRVFYDINELAKIVIVRAIRHKPPHKTTAEIL